MRSENILPRGQHRGPEGILLVTPCASLHNILTLFLPWASKNALAQPGQCSLISLSTKAIQAEGGAEVGALYPGFMNAG